MPTISLTALNVLTIDSAGLTSLKTFLTAQLPPPSSREEKRREEKRREENNIWSDTRSNQQPFGLP